MGLGMIFLSLGVLSSIGDVLRHSDIILQLFSSMGNEPVIANLIAAVLTWVAHSSLAVLLLISVLATGGVFDHGFLAFYLVLGINAGAALPAFTLTMSEPPSARQIALGNLIFRLVGVVLAALLGAHWMPLLAEWNMDAGQKLILLHIGFNSLLLVLFIGSTEGMARLTSSLVPVEDKALDEWEPRYLDPSAQEVPTIALTMVARETLRMVDVVEMMLQRSMEALETDDASLCEETHQLDDRVDSLYEAIKFYVTDLTRAELEKEEGKRAFEIISFTTNLENAGDVIDRSLLNTVSKKIKARRKFSEQGFAELKEMYEYLRETIHLASNVFMERTVENARLLLERKRQFREIEKKSTDRHHSRLRSGETKTIETSAYHLDILRDFKRINSHFASVAYPILEAVDELRDSRLK
jgi:phosphate:Na+ symporter